MKKHVARMQYRVNELRKPTVMIIKSSPWKSAHFFRSHPEYSAIFNLIQSHGSKIRFVLVGTSTVPTSTISLHDDVIAWDIQTGKAGSITYYIELMKLLFKYKPRLAIVLGGLNVLPVAIYSILSWKCNYVCLFAGDFGYYSTRITGRFLSYLGVKVLAIFLQLSQRRILDALAVSKSVQKKIEKSVPSLRERTRLVSYPLSKFYSTQEPTVHKSSKEPMILTVAGIQPIKGLDALIEAISLIRRKLKVLVIGSIRDPTYMHQLMEMVKDRDLKDKVTFITETIDNSVLPSYYKSATLFVLPSRSEGCPVVLLEALHLGVPVIATSVGGNPDLIEDRVNGILIKPNEPSELANAISLLLESNDMRKNLAKNARRILFERYYKGRITLEEAFNQSVTRVLSACAPARTLTGRAITCVKEDNHNVEEIS